MKPQFEKKDNFLNASVVITHLCLPHFVKEWHYHEVYELSYIVKSTGTRYVGDKIIKFYPGDLIIMGPMLPHSWLNSEVFYKGNPDLRVEEIVIHFDPNTFGKKFFEIPEMKALNDLFIRANRGLRFKNPSLFSERIKGMSALDDFERVIELFSILKLLSEDQQYELLASPSYIRSIEGGQNKRMEKVYQYVMDNFQQSISLEEIANVANMNPAAFSRYFKRITHKGFSYFLNEIRIGYACKLLSEEEYNIAQISFDSGFNNLSNFNKQFRSYLKITPSEYINSHKLKLSENL